MVGTGCRGWRGSLSFLFGDVGVDAFFVMSSGGVCNDGLWGV